MAYILWHKEAKRCLQNIWKQEESEDIKCEIYHMQHGEGYMNDDLILENCKDGLQNVIYTLLQDKCNVTHQVVMHVWNIWKKKGIESFYHKTQV